ncbi:MAG: type II toxin-antitoxin system RelE/ParE family toxin [Nitrospiraceae bacterium]|nr:type II toxin-antitoxin system RelE/ParE family toxin [Nitrospiraceae bacterium]
MAYKLQWHEDAFEDLKALDKDLARKIIGRIKKYLTQDPLKIGKPLTGQFSGLWRYRYGDYRVIYVVDIEAEAIRILKVRHRNTDCGPPSANQDDAEVPELSLRLI